MSYYFPLSGSNSQDFVQQLRHWGNEYWVFVPHPVLDWGTHYWAPHPVPDWGTHYWAPHPVPDWGTHYWAPHPVPDWGTHYWAPQDQDSVQQPAHHWQDEQQLEQQAESPGVSSHLDVLKSTLSATAPEFIPSGNSLNNQTEQQPEQLAEQQPEQQAEQQPEQQAEQQPEQQAEEQPAKEQPELQADEQPAEEQPELQVEEQPAEEQPELQVEEQPAEEQAELQVKEQPAEEQPELQVEEQPAEEQPELQVEEQQEEEQPAEEQPELQVEEQPAEEQPELQVEEQQEEEQPAEAQQEEEQPAEEQPELQAEEQQEEEQPAEEQPELQAEEQQEEEQPAEEQPELQAEEQQEEEQQEEEQSELVPSEESLNNESSHPVEDDDDKTTLAGLVKCSLRDLSSSPASFDSAVGCMTSVLNCWVTTEELLMELVEEIYIQSISNSKFSTTGARICNHLAQHLTIRPPSGSFRQLLLKRCQKEFEQKDVAVRSDIDTQTRFHSFVHFLGQLYLRLEVKSAIGPVTRANILLNALKELLNSLLSNPEKTNIACAAELLQCTGAVLEDAWTAAKKPYMDELIQHIENVLLEAECSSDAKRILLQVIKLRSQDWGRVCAASSNTTPDNDSNCFRKSPHVDEEQDKAVLANLLVHFLGKLDASPKSFAAEIESMTTALNSWVTTEERLQELVEQLFTESIGIPKFANTAARMCNHLAQHLTIKPPSGSFRQLLLKRCRLEYDQRDVAVRGDAEVRNKFHLFVHFIGQLYLHLEVMSAKGPATKANIFCKGLKNIVISLLSHPVRANIKCAAELLQCTGAVLEDAWTAAKKPHMDELIQHIENVLLEAECSRNVKLMLLELVKLRTKNWGRVCAPAPAFTEVL